METAIMVNLQYSQKHKIFGVRASDRYCTHMTPHVFKDGLQSKILRYGGRQTRFEAGKTCYRIDDCNNETASKILCVGYGNNERLQRTDDDGIVYEAGSVTIRYSEHTLKLSVMYSVDVIKDGRKQIKR